MANALNLLFQTTTSFPNSSFSSNFKSSRLPCSSTSFSAWRLSWMEVNSNSHITLSTTNGRRRNHIYSVSPAETTNITALKDLYNFIISGPLLDKLSLTSEEVVNSIDKWLTNGSQLCRLFQINEVYLSEAQKVRIYHYYIPVFLWCENQVSLHASMFKDQELPPLVVHWLLIKLLLLISLVTSFVQSRNC